MTRVAVAGALARRAGAGGHAWVFLQYLLGFRRLGHEVLFVDWLDEGEIEPHRVAYLQGVAERFGLSQSYSLIVRGTQDAAGLPRDRVAAWLRDADVLLNVMGYLDDEELLAAPRRRVFLDIDPGLPQMWRELGLADVLTGHDAFVTIGERIGRPDCTVPTCGLAWITTPQPVVLEHWPVAPGGDRFTSVAAWRGGFGPIEHGGRSYGVRAHEFRKLASLPQMTGAEFEIALDIDAADARDRALLEQGGWRLADPRAVAQSPDDYAAWIRGSSAELMVAKNLYVDTRSGWMSDRSICYLASGKPVVAQDTGIVELFPTGEGLLAFTTLEQAAAAVEEVRADYERHSRAARGLAVDYFDSDKVLARLLEQVAT